MDRDRVALVVFAFIIGEGSWGGLGVIGGYVRWVGAWESTTVGTDIGIRLYYKISLTAIIRLTSMVRYR
jgi:hypothetical protein